MSYLVNQARVFATAAHHAIDHRRKYTGEPYITHPKAVAQLVQHFGGDEAMQAAAWLHDVVEDTKVELSLIHEIFGEDVALLVAGLTDVSKPEDGNREYRKTIDRIHTSQQTARCQMVKLCDLIDNTRTIVTFDPKFAKVFLNEKKELLNVMNAAHIEWPRAMEMADTTLWTSLELIEKASI